MRNDNPSLGDLLRDQLSDPWAVNERNDSVGAVVTFKPGINRDEANKVLNELARRGIINWTQAHEYDSSMGGPVWYIP